MMNKLFAEMTDEERKAVYDETYKDIDGCCYPWEEPFEVMDGICPDCGRATTNGKCVCGCWTGVLRTKDESLKRWNNRPIEDELIGKIGKLEAENARLREALTEIKKTVESAQDTVYPFHLALDSKDGVFILETAENALKGNENV